ncbi:MAG: ZIP family metal transporter [Candidatus Diapherotrites archaeon]|nr:ZIP family metal transporter [Candidatus Diapherotrites archaeon]
MLIELFLSLLAISLVSLIGLFSFAVNSKKIGKLLGEMVAFAVGALLGDVFIHLLPELGKNGFSLEISITILAGMVSFFVLEKFIHWHHCHHVEHGKACQRFTYMSIYGDALHNFIDGIILAGAFISGNVIGFSTAIAVFLHEVPQEIGDFGILLKGGFTKKRALFYNFVTALTTFVGAGFALYFSTLMEGIAPFFIAFAAGSFLYIAGTDLLPELHKEFSPKKIFSQIFFIILGIGVMGALLLIG